MGSIGLQHSSNLDPIKLSSWNVRGAGRKSFYSQVKFLMAKYNPDVMVFMETRVNSNKASKIVETLNWPNFVEIRPEGFSGRI